ncbi:MAG TPA: ChbG/HpnK family deacetylase [Firmicutes bacterium]|nr:ChbG/HpnK family deacetylase [Bacillota bacterium]
MCNLMIPAFLAILGLSLILVVGAEPVCAESPPMYSKSPNVAERLGYPADSKLLIIHCDDTGLSYASNKAVQELLTRGIARSASVMMPCSWAYDFQRWFEKHPEYDVGIHITLTSEWDTYRWRPISCASEVGGLIDQEGFMWRDVRGVASSASPEEVKKEIRAQVKQALDWGVRPTHLDTHMGTVFATPGFFEAYIEVAGEFGILPMLINPTEEIIRDFESMGVPHAGALAERMRDLPFPKLDNLITDFGGGDDYESRKQAIYQVLRDLKPGLTQIIIHPALDTLEMHSITDSWKARYLDYKIFMEDETQRLLDELNIKVITWKELASLM